MFGRSVLLALTVLVTTGSRAADPAASASRCALPPGHPGPTEAAALPFRDLCRSALAGLRQLPPHRPFTTSTFAAGTSIIWSGEYCSCSGWASAGSSRPGAAATGRLFFASRLMSLLYGAALTLDEFALWLNLEDLYWARQGRESIDSIILFGALLLIAIWGAGFFKVLAREWCAGTFFHDSNTQTRAGPSVTGATKCFGILRLRCSARDEHEPLSPVRIQNIYMVCRKFLWRTHPLWAYVGTPLNPLGPGPGPNPRARVCMRPGYCAWRGSTVFWQKLA
jgi:hypothetical protein